MLGLARDGESSRNTAGSMMEIMNKPEYIYKSLRAAGTKKKVMATLNIAAEIDDEETIYKRQRYEIEKLLKNSERGVEDSQFEMEGLLYYRFNYDHEREENKQKTLKAEDERVGTRDGKHGSVTSNNVKDDKKAIEEGPETTMLQEEERKGEYEKLMVSQYKGKAQLHSDLNDVNLSRMRRAIYMRLNNLEQGDYLVDQRELHDLRSDMDCKDAPHDHSQTPLYVIDASSHEGRRQLKNGKYPAANPGDTHGEGSPKSGSIHRKKVGTKADTTRKYMSPDGHTSILRGEELGADSPLHEIRDRALQSYVKSMGFERYQGSTSHAFGIGTPSATSVEAASTRTSPTHTKAGLPGSAKAKFAEATISKGESNEGRQMSGGLSNKEFSVKALTGVDYKSYQNGDNAQIVDYPGALSESQVQSG